MLQFLKRVMEGYALFSDIHSSYYLFNVTSYFLDHYKFYLLRQEDNVMAEIASIKDRVAAMEEKLNTVHEQTRINAIFDVKFLNLEKRIDELEVETSHNKSSPISLVQDKSF